MNTVIRSVTNALLLLLMTTSPATPARGQTGQDQLARWLERFPDADLNRDGKLTASEVETYRQQRRGAQQTRDTPTRNRNRNRPADYKPGAPPPFPVDPGWDADRFPDHAVSHKPPERIAAVYAQTGARDPVTSYPKPTDGSLRIVGTGHSFMRPGYTTFPIITKAAGLQQPPLFTHTGGGMTGSARYKWEQENGIFEFDRKPTPKLLASIANAEWDAMMWGPYFYDRPEYYACWIDFCLKYNPDMRFYLADVWPQIDQLDSLPTSEDELTAEVITRMGREKRETHIAIVNQLNRDYDDRVFILPVGDAMVLAAQHYLRGQLPGVEGLHAFIGKKERSLWRDRLGHLGPGFGNLEGYVFYATLYGRSPELINDHALFDDPSGYPSRRLDKVFRKIAWQAVLNHELSGVTDQNQNGIDDNRE
ncbi:MAG: hypothetical protein ACYTGQ_19675 [Planctomycetota bacterium]|jgi:hypothetical protein